MNCFPSGEPHLAVNVMLPPGYLNHEDMAMARRGRERDLGKELYWRDVHRRQRQSGKSVSAFCREQGLSQPSFYAWQRTLAERDQQASSPPVTGRSHLPAFVPVCVTSAPLSSSSTASLLEVVVGRGRVIRVSPGFDPAALRSLLAVLEEVPPC
jgi:transposase-like protein